jgi:CO/xanthine dehydrogenase FAD-binding subunit
MNPATDSYLRPETLQGALTALANGQALVMAGGTDIYPAHVGRPLAGQILDISAIAGLRGITTTGTAYRIGAATTWSDIVRAELPPAFDGLKQAARHIGAIQVQNRGTIGGNLCNASPAADGVPPLLALDAEIELSSARGKRQLPVAEFILGNRRTVRQNDELLTAIIVPSPSHAAKSAFVKLGARKYLVISIVMAAALIERNATGGITHARVAVGAASETARRLHTLEADLLKLPVAAKPSSVITPEHLKSLSPITDVRASAAYRQDAALALVAEVLDSAA